MAVYALRRLLWMLPVLWFIATLSFVLMHSVPGGPFESDRNRTPRVSEALERRYGLHDPLIVQYGRFLGGLLEGDLGVSFRAQGRPVTEVLRDGVGTSATLGLLAGAVAALGGVGLGTLAALNRGGPIDHAVRVLAVLAAGFPTFVLATFLVAIVALELGWTPALGWGSWRHTILPVISLSALPGAYLARVTRASVLDVLAQDYIRTAHAKGLRRRLIVQRHILRNALVPVLSVGGPIAAALITGSFIIEHFFAIPGIGRAFVDGVFGRDYGLIMGTTLFLGAVIVLVNLTTDLVSMALDPRVRHD